MSKMVRFFVSCILALLLSTTASASVSYTEGTVRVVSETYGEIPTGMSVSCGTHTCGEGTASYDTAHIVTTGYGFAGSDGAVSFIGKFYSVQTSTYTTHTIFIPSKNEPGYRLHYCTTEDRYLPVFYHTTPLTTHSYFRYNATNVVNKLILKNCVCSTTVIPSIPAVIEGGSYSGRPALNSTLITVNKGTITDESYGVSLFMLGEDSEQTVTTSDGKTITTVKLSNPPVIIDWADFPG